MNCRMHYRQLGRTGLSVSVLSLGASSFGGVFGAVDERECIRTVHTALDLGINFIDVAPYYGATRAETVLGRALTEICRERYILATKIGRYGESEFDFSAARTRQSVEESCGRLGVEYLDIVQCHDIEFADLSQIVNETLPALVQLREAGVVGHVGITGLPLKVFPAVIDRVGSGIVETVLSFCRRTLLDSALDILLPYFQKTDVGVINASPTAMGLLTEAGPPPWHPAPPAMFAAARRAVEFCQAKDIDIVQLAVQFAIGHPGVSTTLVGTANEAQIRRNIGYAETAIDFGLMADVLKVLEPIRSHNFTRGRPENRDPVIM